MIETSPCYTKAIELLAIRDHAKKELLTKLRRYDFEESEIQDVLECLIEKGYLNEDQYKRVAIRSYSSKKYSVRQIQEKLSLNGISTSEGDIREQLTEHGINYQDIIVQQVEKNIRSLQRKELSRHELEQKILSRLYAKGFKIDEVKKAINLCLSNNNSEL